MRTLYAPCLAAMAKISSRFSLSSSGKPISFQFQFLVFAQNIKLIHLVMQ
jgi:hypothetical protein